MVEDTLSVPVVSTVADPYCGELADLLVFEVGPALISALAVYSRCF